MFGFIVASLPSISEEEKARYQACYCGLCRELKERYGQVSRLALNYDLTFYILLSDSLHEPIESTESIRCLMHPAKPRPCARSRFSALAADFTVALAYHKALDDVRDTGRRRAKIAAHTLEAAYRDAKARIPEPCRILEEGLAAGAAIESAAGVDGDPDAAAHVFGLVFGAIFGYEQGFWRDAMAAFGEALGRFVYLMDAAVDAADDRASGSYNPFVALGLDRDPATMRVLLADACARVTAIFQTLPLERDVHLMESVLYEGVWQQFNKTYNTDDDNRSRR